MSQLGGAGKLTIQNWFSGSRYHIETMQTSSVSSDGAFAYSGRLMDTSVAALVNAMSQLTPPSGPEVSADTSYGSLRDLITSQWHVAATSLADGS